MHAEPNLPHDDKTKTRARRSSSALWRFARTLVVSYFLLCLLIMFLERFLIYLPPPPLGDLKEVKELGGEEIRLQADDGTRLHGWFFAHENPRMALLYAYGNGEDAARNSLLMAYLRDRLHASVFVCDYRGYGFSEGTPHETELISDGLVAQRWLAERLNIATSDVVLYGRSLGGGVIVALAEKLGARALVLHSTFANMTDVGAHHYFWLPVRLLMRNRYPSEQRIKNYDGPLLQIHGAADRIVPLQLARPLFDASPSKHKQFLEVPGIGHNDPLPQAAFESLVEFLKNLPEQQ